MNYCKRLEHIPDIPIDLKNSLLEEFSKIFSSKKENVRYCHFETKNKKNIAYIEKEEDFEKQYGVSGGVSLYSISFVLKKQLISFLQQYEKIEKYSFGYVSVDGGNYVAPHTDDRIQRRESIVYLVDPGTSPAKTVWYHPKEEFKKHIQTDGVGIPYDRLVPVEEHIIETGAWYWMKNDVIHSVENLGTGRFFVSMLKS